MHLKINSRALSFNMTTVSVTTKSGSYTHMMHSSCNKVSIRAIYTSENKPRLN